MSFVLDASQSPRLLNFRNKITPSVYAEAARIAIEAASGQTKLVEQLAQLKECRGISQENLYWRIQKWAYKGIAPRFVLLVESVSGVSRHILRPDLHGEAA